MNPKLKLIILGLLLILSIVAYLIYDPSRVSRRKESNSAAPDIEFKSDPPLPPRTDAPPPPTPLPPNSPNAVLFDSKGVEDTALVVEHVAGAGNSKIAQSTISADSTARQLLILVDGPARYFSLESGLSHEAMPWLQAQGFVPPPAPISRHMSIFRSVASGPMHYQAGRDRIIVLLCPKSEWSKISPMWPK